MPAASQAEFKLPYKPLRQRLYTPRELLARYPKGSAISLDDAVLAHYTRSGGHDPDVRESRRNAFS